MMQNTEKRTILVSIPTSKTWIEMIVPVPSDRDDEEYIDEFLYTILNVELRYDVAWGFVDGMS